MYRVLLTCGNCFFEKSKIEIQQVELKKICEQTGLNRREFADYFEIPLRTVEDWEAGKRKMPPYLLRLISYKVKIEAKEVNQAKETKNVNIICDVDYRKYSFDYGTISTHDIRNSCRLFRRRELVSSSRSHCNGCGTMYSVNSFNSRLRQRVKWGIL